MVAVAAVASAIAALLVVPVIFGEPFSAAVAMVTILLVASVPSAASLMLDSAFTAAGDPGAALRAELLGLAVTVPALLILLPSYGGRGEAVASLIAYTVQLVFQLPMAARMFGERWWRFVVPTREDAVWVSSQVANAWATWRIGAWR